MTKYQYSKAVSHRDQQLALCINNTLRLANPSAGLCVLTIRTGNNDLESRFGARITYSNALNRMHGCTFSKFLGTCNVLLQLWATTPTTAAMALWHGQPDLVKHFAFNANAA